jgi:two-component system CheB/CheR fusion protein
VETNDVLQPGGPFPMAGIGACAGGLVTMEQFLPHVPLNCGMAFVFAPHLDPHREGLLVGLLQRHTTVPVVEALETSKTQGVADGLS